MNDRIHPKLDLIFAMTDALALGTREVIRAAQKHYPRNPRRRGATLRPGAGAPFWGALVLAVRPWLKRRGEKAQLARLLGVHPARVHDYFVKTSAMPDAERTLLLLQWLAIRRSGQIPG